MKNSIKWLCLLIFLLATNLNLKAQYLSDTLVKQPDGISIFHFNADDLQNWKEIFICDEYQILFPNIRYMKNHSVKIENKDILIQRVKLLISIEFIQQLKKCCDEKGCPDTSNGYRIAIKKNGIIEEIYIDKEFTTMEMCGDETLNEVLYIFEELSK